jgi:hypothetical protein
MNRVIPLDKPIKGPQGLIGKITLREPAYRDYMDLGEPVAAVSMGGGASYLQESSAVIDVYIQRLADIDPNLLELLSFRDTLRLREEVLLFFQEARMPKKEAAPAPPPLGDSSSFASDSTREPSKI